MQRAQHRNQHNRTMNKYMSTGLYHTTAPTTSRLVVVGEQPQHRQDPRPPLLLGPAMLQVRLRQQLADRREFDALV